LLTGCILLVYLLFLTKTFYWDGVLFAIYIEGVHRGEMVPTALLHPNHLLYTAFGYGLYALTLRCGISPRAITVMQVANAFLSAACALLIFRMARRVTGSLHIAFFAMVLFAFGATWWKFSTDADAYIASVLLSLGAIWFVLSVRRFSLIAACACHVAAMLLHELAIFLYFPFLLAIWMRGRSMKRTLTCLVASAIIVFTAYYAAYMQVNRQSYPTLFSWISSYASDTPVTHSARQVFAGYLGSYGKLFLGGKVTLARLFMGPTMACALVLSVIATAAFVYLLKRPRRGPPSPHAIVSQEHLWVLWAWFLPLAVFLAIFDPASAFHKLFVWPAIVLLIAAYVAARPRLRSRSQASLALATAIAAWNFGVFIWPHSHSNADPVLALAQQIDRELPKNATVYYAAFSPDDWYLDYFAPGRSWKALQPGERLFSTGPTTVCVETTALQTIQAQPAINSSLSWHLVTPQHNIRMGCLKPAR
jgi:hypothetical protein